MEVVAVLSVPRRSTRRWTAITVAVAAPAWGLSAPAAHAARLGGAHAGARAARGVVPAGTAVSVVLGATNTSNGLAQVDGPDGRTAPVVAGGLSGRANAAEDQPPYPHNMYFQVDDSVAYSGSFVAQVSVQYYDQGTNQFALQYDSTDCS